MPLEDGILLSKSFKNEFLVEFFTVEEGGHNDLIKNHKVIIFKKLREFLAQITKICFNEYSSNAEINSEFFKKLSPHEGDKDFETDRINDDNFNNLMIKHYVENNELEEINKFKSEVEDVLHFDKSKENKNNNENDEKNEIEIKEYNNSENAKENEDIIIEIKD